MTRNTTTLLLLLLVCTANGRAAAQSDLHARHDSWRPSSEREVFNRSPFRKARLIPGVVEVSIPINTTNQTAQKFFDQGLGFFYAGLPLEAERSFHTAHASDEEALMPRWGLAMTLLVREPSAAAIWISGLESLRSSLPGHSRTEKLLLKALPSAARLDPSTTNKWRIDVVKKMRQLTMTNPEVVELRALLACLLSQAWHPWLQEFDEDRDSVMSLINEVLEQSPEHPAGRMGLALWANELRHDPYHTKKKYFDPQRMKLSPVFAGHWTLAGGYSAERGQFATALQHAEVASRIHHQWARLHRAFPDTIPDYARHRHGQGSIFKSTGNAAVAVAIAHELLRLPRHPMWNAETNSFGSLYEGRRLLLESYQFFGLWDDLAMALKDGRIPRPNGRIGRARHAYARAISAYFRTNRATFETAANELNKLAFEVRTAFRGRNRSEPTAVADQHHDGILQWLIDGGEDYLAVTEWNRSLAALKRFEDGEVESAAEMIAGSRRIPPLLRARLLWKIGREREARQALLNTTALPLPVRVQAANLSQQSTKELPLPFKIQRPAVRSARLPGAARRMGLSTWNPPQLPTMSIPLLNGSQLDSKSVKGRHTALIFIYNSTCSHCVDQLSALREYADLLKSAALDVRVVAGQSATSLKKWLATVEQFPATFGADPDEKWFRTIGAYDDFNDMPLHATIYVDPNGRMLWQDIGFEPFMDIPFFVAETLRLRKAYPAGEMD